jgi:hypothetical protein
MKALIDLREKQTSEIMEAIGNLYDEPLKVK